jgi:uncharacterized protein (UPF0332 family)
MQQVTEALEDGRYLLSAGRGVRTVVHRAYYAAFYVPYLLCCKLWGRHHGGTEDDYRSREQVLPEAAAEIIAVAEHFLQAVRDYLVGTGYLPTA